jgi:hypothetical protein
MDLGPFSQFPYLGSLSHLLPHLKPLIHLFAHLFPLLEIPPAPSQQPSLSFILLLLTVVIHLFIYYIEAKFNVVGLGLARSIPGGQKPETRVVD